MRFLLNLRTDAVLGFGARAFVNAGGTARFNPQISRQISWVRVHRKRIEGYFAASASFEKTSVLFKVLDTDFIT
jgi:hypothetical protein